MPWGFDIVYVMFLHSQHFFYNFYASHWSPQYQCTYACECLHLIFSVTDSSQYVIYIYISSRVLERHVRMHCLCYPVFRFLWMLYYVSYSIEVCYTIGTNQRTLISLISSAASACTACVVCCLQNMYNTHFLHGISQVSLHLRKPHQRCSAHPWHRPYQDIPWTCYS